MANEMKDVKIEVKVDEKIAEGTFANVANISHSPDEFVMDFLFIHPTPPPGFGKLQSRIILTPGHAKKIVMALNKNIQEYENRFGEIDISQKDGQSPNIQ